MTVQTLHIGTRFLQAVGANFMNTVLEKNSIGADAQVTKWSNW